MTLLREEWVYITETDSNAELDHELNLLGELRRETSQLIALAQDRKTELKRAALRGRLRMVFGRRK